MDSEILIYQTPDGNTRIDVRLENETVWLSQNLMATLYQTTKQNISDHINKIYKEGELNEELTVKEYLTVQQEGKRSVQRAIKYYNLEVIISVGYRVQSHRGTQFRIWATQRLKEYLTKGFTIDDERLKESRNYFDELLERIRDIRTSEKVFYQKIKDIYATSIDYDPNNQISQKFFSVVQNKLLWAISGHTAAEIIHSRVDAKKPNMGLTNWANQKQLGAIRKGDVTVSKNYLNENEIRALNLLVEQYLAFAESQAHNKTPMYMRDWIKKLDNILTINDREILQHAGRIKKDIADKKADKQFELYKEQQRKIEAKSSFELLEKDIKSVKTKK